MTDAPPISTRRSAEHGTRSKYNSGCRCGACRGANRSYVEAQRRAAGMQPLKRGPQTEHGTAARYHYGCRCPSCRSAHTSYQREMRRRRRDR